MSNGGYGPNPQRKVIAAAIAKRELEAQRKEWQECQKERRAIGLDWISFEEWMGEESQKSTYENIWSKRYADDEQDIY